ncbi:MAG: hypothetical protein AAF497_08345, partial [Planctomycetota bacterium]
LPLAWFMFSSAPPTPTPVVSVTPVQSPDPANADPVSSDEPETVKPNETTVTEPADDSSANSGSDTTIDSNQSPKPSDPNINRDPSESNSNAQLQPSNTNRNPPRANANQNRKPPRDRNTNANLRPTNDDVTLLPDRKPPRQNPTGEVDRTPISDPPAMEVLPPANGTNGDTNPADEDAESDEPLPPGLINELDSGLNAIFEHRHPNYRNHVSYSRNIAIQSRQQNAIKEVRYLESYFIAYTVVWDQVQTAIKNFEAGNQIKIGNSVAAVVEAKPQELILFANRIHKQYLGRRAGSSIVFYDMPKPLIMHLARLPGSDSPQVTRSLAFIDSVNPAELPKDPKDRWDQVKILWEKTGNGDKALLPPRTATPEPSVATPVRQAQMIKGQKNVHTNRFDFDNTEDKLIELTGMDASTNRLQVVNINLGRTLGKLDVPSELAYLETGKPWQLNGDREIPVTLRLSLKNDGVPTITASATYRMIMSRSKRDYPLHLPEVRKKISTVEGAIKKHSRKATLYQNQIKQLQQRISTVAKVRVPNSGAGALAAAQQKQMTLAGLNEQKSKKLITLNSVMKQIKRSEDQRDSYKSILKFGQEMQSEGWIQVKVIEK